MKSTNFILFDQNINFQLSFPGELTCSLIVYIKSFKFIVEYRSTIPIVTPLMEI